MTMWVRSVWVGWISRQRARVAGRFLDHEADWNISRYNRFRLNLEDAELESIPVFEGWKDQGRVLLPARRITLAADRVIRRTGRHPLRTVMTSIRVVAGLKRRALAMKTQTLPQLAFNQLVQAFEADDLGRLGQCNIRPGSWPHAGRLT